MRHDMRIPAVLAATALVSLTQQTLAGSTGGYITSGHVEGAAGALGTEFVGMDFRIAAGPVDPGLPPFDLAWLFELDDLTEANQGDTWITNESSPNFSAFESLVTDGEWSLLWIARRLNLPGVEDFGSINGTALYYVLNGSDAPEPQPGDLIELEGWDLTEVHLTLEQMRYIDGEIVIPGLPPSWGYDFTFRFDFYGNAVPAPSSLALIGFAALHRRRQRRS